MTLLAATVTGGGTGLVGQLHVALRKWASESLPGDRQKRRGRLLQVSTGFDAVWGQKRQVGVSRRWSRSGVVQAYCSDLGKVGKDILT